MWAAWVRYPRFRSKNDAVNTMTMRIQGCFRFSMNGTPPPDDSEIMTALQTYFYWLARGAPTGGRLAGAGFTPLAEPAESPSIARGATVFAGKCAACHGSDGLGRRVTGALGYQFPPLWGPASYNWGAGMTSIATAAASHPRQHALWLRDALTGTGGGTPPCSSTATSGRRIRVSMATSPRPARATTTANGRSTAPSTRGIRPVTRELSAAGREIESTASRCPQQGRNGCYGTSNAGDDNTVHPLDCDYSPLMLAALMIGHHLDFGPLQSGERFGRLLIARRDFEPEIGEPILHRRIGRHR
jgi:hypothetical protein